MSELEYIMKCPNCNEKTIVMFSGSGTKGICMSCEKELPPEKSYLDYKGRIIAYTG